MLHSQNGEKPAPTRSQFDIRLLAALVAIQVIAFVLLTKSKSLGEMALWATASSSLSQALLDFYSYSKGKSWLSAGVRIAGLIVALLAYWLSVKFKLKPGDPL